MTQTDPQPKGIHLPNGSLITHGTSITHKTVFADLGFPVTMHELWPGSTPSPSSLTFGGQLGLIDFTTATRLPRHVHIYEDHFIHERILVLQGVALVEMNGEIYVVPPRTLVTIAPGVPHTWTACPEGVVVGKGEKEGEFESQGRFLMVYEYEDPTSFRPTKQIETLRTVAEYVECPREELEGIRIPALGREEVRERCWFVWNGEVRKGGG